MATQTTKPKAAPSVFRTKFKPLLVTAVSLKPFRRYTRDNMVVVALLFAIVGSVLMFESRAAAPVSDTQSAASSGVAIRTQATADLCLDVAGSTHASGAAVQLWNCNGSRVQSWQRQSLPDGSMALIIDEKCLQGAGGGTLDGTRVQIWKCLDVPAQRWTYDAGGTLRNVHADKCLYATAGSAAGTKLSLKTCDPADPGQLWAIQ